MTRPKVDPDKRQRTAQACDSCKRRKQKCDGLSPCATCQKRSLSCTYTTSDQHSPNEGEPPVKKRLVGEDASKDTSPRAKIEGIGSDDGTITSVNQFANSNNSQSNLSPLPTPTRVSDATQWGYPHWGYSEEANLFGNSLQLTKDSFQPIAVGATTIQPGTGEFLKLPEEQEAKAHPMSRVTTNSGADEEAELYTSTRMVQDSTGRLLYLGESATLSFLQLMRMVVESVAGASSFTTDPKRHRILESSSSLPPGLRYTHVLPDRNTANILVQSFFVNTCGIMQIFDEASFMETLSACYIDPLTADPSWLCLLHLVFAVGLCLAAPKPHTKEAAVIDRLRSEPLDRSEIFYENAKRLSDPITGFEDAGFWSVQALHLMTLYMLMAARRNAAFAYFGMAVRSAFALGLHREETLVMFSPEDQRLRRNVWRSLFVFDRFLSASLGRPLAISEDDCSGDTLQSPDMTMFPIALDPSQCNILGLETAVRSCHAIGDILKRVYQRRRISTKLAQEIADQCKEWPKTTPLILHWGQATVASPAQGTAILHVNLLYCHSIILLTRPFFLFTLNAEIQQPQSLPGTRSKRFGNRMEKFAEACVIASSHSISLVHTAFTIGHLPRRNPFVSYFLFAAALVVLSNEFSHLYPNPSAANAIDNAISIMSYCGEADVHAQRHAYILNTFRDVIISREKAPAVSPTPQKFPFPATPNVSQDNADDPFASIYTQSHGKNNINVNSSPTMKFDGSNSQKNSRKGSTGADHGQGSTAGAMSEESSGGDEQIDFEALWNWSAATPGPTPAPDGTLNPDGAVPLFGMQDFG